MIDEGLGSNVTYMSTASWNNGDNIESKSIIIAVVAVVAIAAIGGGVFMVMNNNGDSDEDKEITVGTTFTYKLTNDASSTMVMEITAVDDEKWSWSCNMKARLSEPMDSGFESIDAIKEQLEYFTISDEKESLELIDGTVIQAYRATASGIGIEFWIDANAAENVTKAYAMKSIEEEGESTMFLDDDLMIIGMISEMTGVTAKTSPFLFVDGEDFQNMGEEKVFINDKYGEKTLTKYKGDGDAIIYADPESKIAYMTVSDWGTFALDDIKY